MVGEHCHGSWTNYHAYVVDHVRVRYQAPKRVRFTDTRIEREHAVRDDDWKLDRPLTERLRLPAREGGLGGAAPEAT